MGLRLLKIAKLYNRVSIVFHVHDHLFAKQDLDGIVYQEVPQLGHPEGGARRAADYGYLNGVILGGSGYPRVTVSNDKTTVAYIRACLPSNEAEGSKNGAVAHSYSTTAWTGQGQ
jgi:hypothetical protein